MAANLVTLPAEIQVEIAQSLGHPQDKLRLMVCSRHFYDLLLPVLYEHVVLDRSPTGAEIAAIVETIFIQKPHLASRIRTLNAQHWDVMDGTSETYYRDFNDLLGAWARGDFEIQYKEGDDVNDRRSKLEDYDFSFVREKLRLVSLSEVEEKFWMAGLEAFNGDAWLGLLLIILPNLRRLELQFPFFRHSFIPWILDCVGNGQVGKLPALKSLSQVALDWWDTEGGLDLKHALRFFRLPSVRQFFGDMVVEYDYDESRAECEVLAAPIRQASSITHIELQKSNSFSGMKPLISSCKKLISFKYEHSWGCVYGEYFDSEAFRSALYPARHTLEALVFEDNSGFGGSDPFTSFREFTALKTLHLDAEMLPECSFGEGLPRSIEILQIRNAGQAHYLRLLVEKLEEHVRNGLDQTPALSEIVIEGSLGVPSPPRAPGEPQIIMVGRNLPQDPAIKGIVSGLENACADAGVKFVLYNSGESWYEDHWGSVGFQDLNFSK